MSQLFIEGALNATLFSGILGVLGLGFGLLSRDDFRPKWLVAAVVFSFVHYFALTRGFFSFPNPEGLNWNWAGKTAAILLTLAVACIPTIGFAKAGLTFKQRRGARLAWLIFAIGAAITAYFAATDGYTSESLEMILFQWTMPGLEEEIFYRGVLLFMLNEALRSRADVLGAPMGWAAVVTSLVFGAAHGLSFSDGALQFSLPLVQTLSAFLFVWMRERTGSVVLPILAHNWGNAIFTVL